MIILPSSDFVNYSLGLLKFSGKVYTYATGGSGGGGGTEKPLLLIIAGQSNAVGFGTTGTDMPSNLIPAQTNVFYWRDIATSGAPNYGWDTYQAGVNSDPGTRGGAQKWGCEAEFARQWRIAHPTQPLYIVKSALSGSQLMQSSIFQVPSAPAGNDWSPETSGKLFDTAITRISPAIATFPGLSITSYDTCVMWMQGESDADAQSPTTAADAYATNLPDLVTNVRSRWGLGSTVPFYLGRISGPSATSAWPYASKVRQAEGLTAAAGTAVKMIDTDTYPRPVDNKHYNATGQQSFGSDFFALYSGAVVQVGVALSASYSATINEQGSNGSAVVTITPTNSPSPSPTYELLSGETAGFTINPDTGAITVSDGTQLVYATDSVRTFVVRATNGAATATTNVTVTLTPVTVTDVANTVLRLDPNDSANRTLVSTAIQTLTDTKGSGRTVTQGSTTKRPVSQTFPGITKTGAFFSNADGTFDALAGAAGSSAICADTDTGFTMATVFRPNASGSGTSAHVLALINSTSGLRVSLAYNYSTNKFVMQAPLASTGAQASATSTSTYATGVTYVLAVRYTNGVCELYIAVAGSTWSAAAMGSFSGALRSTMLATTETGSCVIGGQTSAAGEIYGDIGLTRFVKASASSGEMAFLNTELNTWAS